MSGKIVRSRDVFLEDQFVDDGDKVEKAEMLGSLMDPSLSTLV